MIKPTAGMRRHNDQASLEIRCFLQDLLAKIANAEGAGQTSEKP
jgi:hypothetical protein